MPAPAFSATIVTYRSDERLLARALASLRVAIEQARAEGLAGDAQVFIVDNGSGEEVGRLREAAAPIGAEVIHGQGNVGYGRANNVVLPRLASEYHLVMNPDVELEPEALAAALRALRDDSGVGLVAPAAFGSAGERQYLNKRYPSVWVLFLRGFAPQVLRRRFDATLARYEMRDIVPDRPFAPVPLASGCFMVVRTALFRRMGGFDPRFFMYFEDYDLSLRIGREATVAYIPQARIVHHGGEASRKGVRHVAWFLRSAWRFFATHGWKLA
jgi:GT2 family glycosyltransferase